MKVPPCAGLVVLWCCASGVFGQWPQINGPTGNFAPLPFEGEVVDDISQAKQVWLSETQDLGYAKGSVSGYLQNLARWPGHPGSAAGPIIADGRLFVTTFRPSGGPWAGNQPQYKKWLEDPPKKMNTPEEVARMKRNLRILADDLLVAINLEDGSTAWTANEEGAGLNRYMGKRQGYNVAPAHHDGTVFSLGTTGMLRAYRAKDGHKLWERSIGTARNKALEHKEKMLDRKELPGGMGWNSSLTIAGGVLIVPLFEGGADLGLRGVNPASGDTVWELEKVCSRHATPSTWRHDKREFVLCATVTGELRLIDPEDGTVRWKLEDLGAHHFSLLTARDLVLVNIGTDLLRKPVNPKRKDLYANIGAYRITPDRAEFQWHLPKHPELFYSTWMDNCARRFLATDGHWIYYNAIGTEKEHQRLLVIEAPTGKLVGEMSLRTPSPLFYPLGHRLLMIRDASHSDTHLAMFETSNPRKPRQLTDFWNPPHLQTTAYEVSMECPIVDGRIYMRTKDGRVVCYDLRR